MFLKEKANREGVFERLKFRLAADGRGQDRAHYQGFNSSTATLEVNFLIAPGSIKQKTQMEKDRYWRCVLDCVS